MLITENVKFIAVPSFDLILFSEYTPSLTPICPQPRAFHVILFEIRCPFYVCDFIFFIVFCALQLFLHFLLRVLRPSS